MNTKGSEMIRGCEKRIFYVKNTGSELFDEAYLVLKRKEGGVRRHIDCRELEREASRILNATASVSESGTAAVHGGRDRLKAFLTGAACSAVFTGILTVCVYLLITA